MLWIFDGEVNPSVLLVVGGFCLLSACVCVSVLKAVGVLLFYFLFFPSRCEAISDHTRRHTRLCSRQLASAAAVAWELQIRLKPTGSEQQAPRSLSRQHTHTHTHIHTHSLTRRGCERYLQLLRCWVAARFMHEISTRATGERIDRIKQAWGWERGPWSQYGAPVFKLQSTAVSSGVKGGAGSMGTQLERSPWEFQQDVWFNEGVQVECCEVGNRLGDEF